MEKTTLYFKDGKSDKEYHAILDGLMVTVKWGRRGASLQSKTHTFESAWAARDKYKTMLTEKRMKGYSELPWPKTALANQATWTPSNLDVDEFIKTLKTVFPVTASSPAPKKHSAATPPAKKDNRPRRKINLED